MESSGNVLRLRKFRLVPEGVITHPRQNLPQMTAIENFSWVRCTAPADAYGYRNAAEMGSVKIFPGTGESLCCSNVKEKANNRKF